MGGGVRTRRRRRRALFAARRARYSRGKGARSACGRVAGRRYGSGIEILRDRDGWGIEGPETIAAWPQEEKEEEEEEEEEEEKKHTGFRLVC